MKGSDGVKTKKTNAMEAEISTQCFLAVENIASRRMLEKAKEGRE
jgi:hypothetical protein